MQRHFHEEIEALKQTLLAMGGLVEDQIRRVMQALLERNDALALEVIERDRQVNAYDVEVDETCVNLLALHQPAAGDLRFITTAMKIVTDLERIGDQAVNIAQRALELSQEPQLKPYIDLPRMAEKAQRMVKESLDAFVARDTELARRVCAADGEVDALKEQIFREMLTTVLKMFEDGADLGDIKVANAAFKELRYGFKVFAPYRHVPKVTVFGSARTAADHPVSEQAYGFGKRMTQAGWMVITGAGSGSMGAAQEGAGRERSFGLNIRLPFEH